MRKDQNWHEISFLSSPDNAMTTEASSNVTWSGRCLSLPILRFIFNDKTGPTQCM